MPLDPGTIVPPFVPASVNLDSPVYRPAINCIDARQYNASNTASSGSSTYPGSDSDPAQRLGRFKLPKEYPLYGAPCFSQLHSDCGAILINEVYAGMPPLLPFDQGDVDPGNNIGPVYAPADDVIPTSGYPYWWQTLKDEGYKRNGPAILLEYPGGPEAYFDRFIKDHLCQSLALAIDPDAMVAEPLFSYDGYVVPEPTRVKMRNYTGRIVANMEAFWPYRRDHVYKNNFMGAYLSIFREVMRRINGTYPTDQVLSDTYWDIAWKRLVIPYLRKIKEYCPKASVGIYDLPIGTAEPLVAPYNYYWSDLMGEETDGTMDELWKQVDFLAPSHGYLHYPIVSDNVVPPTNWVKYSYYLYLSSGTTDRCVALRNYSGKPLYVFSRMIMSADPATGRNNTALTDTESKLLAHLVELSNADGVIVWDSIGNNTFTGCTTMEQQLQLVQTGYTRFSDYYNSIARTPRS